MLFLCFFRCDSRWDLCCYFEFKRNTHSHTQQYHKNVPRLMHRVLLYYCVFCCPVIVSFANEFDIFVSCSLRPLFRLTRGFFFSFSLSPLLTGKLVCFASAIASKMRKKLEEPEIETMGTYHLNTNVFASYFVCVCLTSANALTDSCLAGITS